MKKRFLIIGGTGSTGFKIAGLLLKYTDSAVTIAARNKDKIDQAVEQLRDEYRTTNINGVVTDASDKNSLLNVLKNIDMIVVASGTADLVGTVAQAALEADVDYLDIQYSTKKIDILKSFEDEIIKCNRLFITDAGFHPGLPAALVRYSQQEFGNIRSSFIYSVIKQDWRNLNITTGTKIEFVKELVDFEPNYYSDGEWKRASMVSTKDFKKVDFGEPIGVKMCTPMNFEEMKSIPEELPTLKNTGFYIAGFNWFVDMIVMPFGMLWMKIFKKIGIKTIANVMFNSLLKNSKPPFRTIVQLEAERMFDSNPEKYKLKLSHEDGYWFTAIPVVACLIQYSEGILPQKGLYCMGNVVEPHKLLKDMKEMGITIEE